MKSNRWRAAGVGSCFSFCVGVTLLGCTEGASKAAGDGGVTSSDVSVEVSADSSETETASGPLFGGGVPGTSNGTLTSGAPSTPSEAAPAITACSKAVGSGSEPMIDDFDDGDQQTIKHDGRDGTWYFYDDGTSGQMLVNIGQDATGEREGNVLSVTGEGFSDWGSGFGVGLNWNSGQCTYDASVYAGVQFWVRGAGETRVTLQNMSVRPVSLGGQCAEDAQCFDSHGYSFSLSENWTLVRLPFEEFSQAGWGSPVGLLLTDAIYLMEFQFGVVQPFSIWLDDVSFFRNGEPADAGSTTGPTDASPGDTGTSMVDAASNSAEATTSAASDAGQTAVDASSGSETLDAAAMDSDAASSLVDAHL